MNNNVAIEFKDVTKIYKLYKNDKHKFKVIFSKKEQRKLSTKNAINDVSFSIKKGESVALFGKNGAGKSTLLKMITGVAYPTEGEINIFGRVSALLELQAGFDSELTGRENIFFRGQLMGIPDEEMKELEQIIIDFADLGEYIDQPIRTYSSGMKARLGFAINANVKPEILIVDEALSVGDRDFREKCTKKIDEILSSEGVTFLLVTHSTGTAKRMCKRGIVLQNGTMVFDGTIQEAADYYDEYIA